MMKRGVEMSMNVIVIAAIAMIILVILVLLITRSADRVGRGTGCQSNPRGECIFVPEGSSCSEELGDGYVSIASDCPEDEKCCWQPLG